MFGQLWAQCDICEFKRRRWNLWHKKSETCQPKMFEVLRHCNTNVPPMSGSTWSLTSDLTSALISVRSEAYYTISSFHLFQLWGWGEMDYMRQLIRWRRWWWCPLLHVSRSRPTSPWNEQIMLIKHFNKHRLLVQNCSIECISHKTSFSKAWRDGCRDYWAYWYCSSHHRQEKIFDIYSSRICPTAFTPLFRIGRVCKILIRFTDWSVNFRGLLK